MTTQCKACPWKVSTIPEHDIPGGYCATKHEALKSTIADPEVLNLGPLHVMACHESPSGHERLCVGWVLNQLGPGNNIGLRFRAMDGRFRDYETVGEQHERLEDTLPQVTRQKKRKRA